MPPRRLLRCCAMVCGMMAAAVEAQPRENDDLTKSPADQRVVAGIACGPAALLNAFRFGSTDWQRAADAVAGNTDKERMLHILRRFGMRPSRHLPGHARWTRSGVGMSDLRDMADEMTTGLYLPPLGEEVFFLKGRETPARLLERVHRRFKSSLAKGLPPVVSIRRYVLRARDGGKPQWLAVDAHFVTLTHVPKRLDGNTRAFPVDYIDPWGGTRRKGSIGIPGRAVFPDSSGQSSCLEAAFPGACVGDKHVGKGETSFLTISAAIGRW